MRAITNRSVLIHYHHPSVASAFLRSLRHRLPLPAPSFLKVKALSTSASYAELDNAQTARSGSLASPPTSSDFNQKIDVNPPKGTRDFPPEEMRLRSWLFQNFREVICENFGDWNLDCFFVLFGIILSEDIDGVVFSQFMHNLRILVSLWKNCSLKCERIVGCFRYRNYSVLKKLIFPCLSLRHCLWGKLGRKSKTRFASFFTLIICSYICYVLSIFDRWSRSTQFE